MIKMNGEMKKIPEWWTKHFLSDVAEIIKDSWKPWNDKTTYIGLEHINAGDLSINWFGTSEGLESNKFHFKAGDILFGKLRPYFRKVALMQFDGVSSTDIWVVRAKAWYDQRYLFYFMANKPFIDASMGANTWTHMPRADWNYLSKTSWYFPNYEEQKNIANILSSLDDKIELLRKQNETLEKTATTLFFEWFGKYRIDDELPKGWRIGKLGESVEHIKMPVLPQNRQDETFSHFSIPAFDDWKKPAIEKWETIMSSKYSVPNDSFLVSKLNPSTPRIWTVFNVPENSICSTEFQVIKPKIESSFAYVWWVLNSKYFTDKFASGAQGTSGSHQRARPNDILDMDVVIPNFSTIKEFNELVIPTLRKSNENLKSIKLLSDSRDTLLPKLMSGEKRVGILDS